jgi:hypothetical protein
MAIGAQSVPMRWMAGPLDIARRQREQDFTAEMAEPLRKWQDPSLLALVQGTFTCADIRNDLSHRGGLGAIALSSI